MTQPNLLELAKKGDAQAIASVINYLLQPKGVSAKAILKDSCLQIILESFQVPEQESSVTFIHKLIIKLEAPPIKSVKIYGKKKGQTSVSWINDLNLSSVNDETKKYSSIFELAKQGKYETLSKIWPVWFPYPSSWLRAIILVPIAFPGTRLIVFGLAGVFISVIGNSPILLIFSILFGLLIPTAFLAFVYHIFWFIWQKPKSSNKLPKWMPTFNSLWAGFYSTLVMGLSFMLILTIFSELAFFSCNFYNKIPEYFNGCTGNLTGRATNGIFYSIENNDFLSQRWFMIWIFTAAYLYQLEHLVIKCFIPKLKVLLQNLQTRPKSYSVDRTDLEIDRLRGDMGLTQIKKGKKQHLFIKSLSQYHYQTPKKLNKKLLIIMFIPLVAIGIYLLATIPKMEEQSTNSIISQVSSPTPFSAALIPQADTFREAVSKAINAANLTQSAKSPDEWKTVVSQWKTAITLMKTVPSSSPNYVVAQQKITEYQRNLNYAEKNSLSKK
ncbi:hypothetical protein [Nostoc sp. ATCC 53789]|uniref:hypothetical protein n=1 Tax=Nostoc sp. ATCC 53789 TaxID=76335 RepID=UPI000DED16E3|nr:hypothetical protein [Nostoc sp. ATCC 53789]QHG18912.1 hypothetical protein GJB62_25065 [Nostoc sp. ATCC 53789]RCJ22745.1 hypothetical protein A6V25_23685 [Nostoc sp. ATCC 53789]